MVNMSYLEDKLTEFHGAPRNFGVGLTKVHVGTQVVCELSSSATPINYSNMILPTDSRLFGYYQMSIGSSMVSPIMTHLRL